ncbi:MAG: peptide deformylase [Acidimicrobiales bacterium]
MAPHPIRLVGDPVLRQRAVEVTDIDAKLARLAHDMITTMHQAPGVGLAAPQVGVQRRLFVYDLQDGQGAKVVVNPVIIEATGEWVYEEGCLSVPGLAWEIARPAQVHLVGQDLDGEEISVQASELAARVFLHEVDHLDGVLLVDLLGPEQRREARRALRERLLAASANGGEPRPRLRLPVGDWGRDRP